MKKLDENIKKYQINIIYMYYLATPITIKIL